MLPRFGSLSLAKQQISETSESADRLVDLFDDFIDNVVQLLAKRRQRINNSNLLLS